MYESEKKIYLQRTVHRCDKIYLTVRPTVESESEYSRATMVSIIMDSGQWKMLSVTTRLVPTIT